MKKRFGRRRSRRSAAEPKRRVGQLWKWLAAIVVMITGLGAWWAGFLNHYLPCPEQVTLAVGNRLRGPAEPAEDRFRVLLCWLESDRDGRSTSNVAQAFTSIQGIELVRSARVVAASGAADHWREAMRKEARAVLEDWDADLAVVGLVKQPGGALNLWFVPTHGGEGTLARGDTPYELNDATLGPDFHDDFGAELAAVALVAVAPLARTEIRGRVLEEGLQDATEKLATLLENPSAVEPSERRGRLHLSLGSALAALGERESGSDGLERAVASYRAALREYTRERVPLSWAMAQNGLGAALAVLGERESDRVRLEEAIAALRAALGEYTRGHVPLLWAMVQHNLGATLALLGEREGDTALLEESVAAYRAALEERTRARVPLDWAATQNNLGHVLGFCCGCVR